jgi:hypothetical protein
MSISLTHEQITIAARCAIGNRDAEVSKTKRDIRVQVSQLGMSSTGDETTRWLSEVTAHPSTPAAWLCATSLPPHPSCRYLPS